MAGRTNRRLILTALPLLAASVPAARAADTAQVETIVMVRHGEKPAGGLGQLNCQGLNRSLALPGVLAGKFARPAAIYAPNPAARKPDGTGTYYYIRPLATIEPTAISLGLPVNAGFGYTDIAGLQKALTEPQYRAATVLVAWEHKQIVPLAKNLLAADHGNPATVPAWNTRDFDSIYVVRIHWAPAPSASFEVSHEGLNGQPAACPAK